MQKIIDIESHAFFRMLERGIKFRLSYYETKERAFSTVRLGKLAKRKHLSKDYKTYNQYFKDNLSFYVICKERQFENYMKYMIKTVIIEEGRE